MFAWKWSQICGHGVNNFTVWNHDDFGHCFEQLVFVCSSHALLLLMSVYYIARYRRREIDGEVPTSGVLVSRVVVTFLLATSPLLQLLLNWAWLKTAMSLVDILTSILTSVSWLVHFGFVLKLQRLYHVHLRGPLLLVVTYFLTVASVSVHIRTVILHLLQHTHQINRVDSYIAFVIGGFHLLYIISLIPWTRPSLLQFNLERFGINNESDPLLESVQPITSYGGVNQSFTVNLGVAEEGANILSRLTFWWVKPLMVQGYHGNLDSPDDLFELPAKLAVRPIDERFQTALKKNNIQQQLDEQQSNQQPDVKIKEEKRTLYKSLNQTFGLEYYSLGIIKLLGDGLGFASPLLLNLLVSFMENRNEPVEHGYYYALGLFLSTLLGSLLASQFNYYIQIVGLKIRSAIITAVYQKTLNSNSVGLSKFSTGEIVNFMSTDTDRIVNFCPSFHQFWSLPFQIAVSLYLLYQQIGLAFLAGLAFAIILIPINKWLANKIGELSTRMMEQKDNRVKVMNEILFGIRVIKFYAWEEHFEEKIKALRGGELASLRGRKYLDAWCVYFWATTPVLISILSFSTYVLMGHQLTAAKVFTSLALFNMLISPLNAFPWVINGLMEAWVSVKRLQLFVELPELDLNNYYKQDHGLESNTVLSADEACFDWYGGERRTETTNQPSTSNATNSQHGTLTLGPINLSITKGELIGVIGKVGCGKSSLLAAILAEMHLSSGSIAVNGLKRGFGVAMQESWIQHATLKENILFGKQFNRKKYESVLEACALKEDLKILPRGDITEIGENGVTLSGGQKARVSLARAVYQDKDIYLLDDPLSAVDAHVAKHLFDQCIMGVLRKKTRILCTHHTKYLRHADRVILVEDGKICDIGPPDQILSSIDIQAISLPYSATESGPESHDSKIANEDPGGEDGGLVQEEERDQGVVKFDVYKSYWVAVGHCLAPAVLISLLLMQGSRNVSDWWLSYWVTYSHHPHPTSSNTTAGVSLSHNAQPGIVNLGRVTDTAWTNVTEASDNVQFYLTVYGALAGANSLFTLLRAFLFAYGGLCAAAVIHEELLSTILKAPVSFFDVTPIGRILNRFSSDLYSIDDSLPFIMNILFAQFYGVIGTLAITCYGLPWFAILLVPLGGVYYYIQRYYRHTSREIKRITSVTLSPMYAHFSESITGLTTIRALRESPRFKLENEMKLEANQRAQFASVAVARWLDLRLQMIGVAMVTGVAFIAVLEHHYRTVNPGLVGLAISYALSITSLLSGVVTSFTETEKQMVSVERAAQYVNDVPQEKQNSILMAPPYWPIQGAVTFHRVHLQYRQGLPLALNDVTFETNQHEKIGIVGRTGSGKSSLFLALFRMVELHSGQILVDGIDVKHLDLHDLRSHLAIIPQDPFLFSGSVRSNLDPTNEYPDGALWKVLERCHLQHVVERLGGLDAQVAERGRHFSVGQRQLVCLARALLTNAKVLCIDEATASVDLETDRLLQQTIREEFADNTVLTIAHRINTVLDSDRVLVMNKGQVAEFDNPASLLRNNRSLFYSLVHGSG